MVFGVLLGTAVLTLFSMLRVSVVRPDAAKSIADAVVGARGSTGLRALFATPTFHAVVIAVSLAVLPSYMLLGKLTLTLLFILVGLPMLERQSEGARSGQTDSWPRHWFTQPFAIHSRGHELRALERRRVG